MAATMPTLAQVVSTLGGAKTLRSVRTPADLRAHLRRGLPYGALEELAAAYGIASGELSSVLGIPPRTLARRRKQSRFRADESDRLYRLARIAALAEEVLGDRARAGRWLQRPNRALGGETPLGQVDTELGARAVEDLLGRIAFGVHS